MANTLEITLGFANILKQNGGYSNMRNLEAKLELKTDIYSIKNQENLAILSMAERNNLITF